MSLSVTNATPKQKLAPILSNAPFHCSLNRSVHYNILDSKILLDLHRQAHRTKTERRATAEQLHCTGVPQLNHRGVQDDHSMWGDHDKQAQEAYGITNIQSHIKPIFIN